MSAMVLEDKLLMHTVVDRVAESCDIKQLPLLHWKQNTLEGKTRANGGDLKFVKGLLAAGFGVLVKPSHGANNEGNAKVTQDKKEYFEKAMLKALSARYEDGSTAVARVLPGAIAQPLYPAPGVEFWNETNLGRANFPLELKVQVMWGKAFLASDYHGDIFHPEQDLFFERPSLSSNEWRATPFFSAEAPPDARYGNGGKVSLYLEQFLPKVASQAECLAGRLGAPWLRVDFFVPPPGAEGVPVVFNEIEYNSGVIWRRLQMPIEPWKSFKYYTIKDTFWDDIWRWLSLRDMRDGPTKGGLDIFEDIGCTPKERNLLTKWFSKALTPEESYRSLVCHGASGASTDWKASKTAGASK